MHITPKHTTSTLVRDEFVRTSDSSIVGRTHSNSLNMLYQSGRRTARETASKGPCTRVYNMDAHA